MDNRILLDFLASRYARAQRELDELRQRGLELVIAACAADVAKRPPAETASVATPLDPSALSEADVTGTSDVPRTPTVEATVTIEPKKEPEPEPESVRDTPPPTDEFPDPQPTPVRPQTPPKSAPPISPDPGVEDVRGAWGPPPGG
jgi:hypothetical protein